MVPPIFPSFPQAQNFFLTLIHSIGDRSIKPFYLIYFAVYFQHYRSEFLYYFYVLVPFLSFLAFLFVFSVSCLFFPLSSLNILLNSLSGISSNSLSDGCQYHRISNFGRNLVFLVFLVFRIIVLGLFYWPEFLLTVFLQLKYLQCSSGARL